MILSRLLMYKSPEPTSYLPRRKPKAPLFDREDINRLIDAHHERLEEYGFEKLIIPAKLHEILPDSFPANVKYVAGKLNDHGFCAYLCGGTVRDLVQNTPVNDFDLVTDATPEELKGIFDAVSFHRIPAGHEFGYIEFDRHEIIDVCTMVNIPAAFRGEKHVPDFDPGALYSKELLFDALQRDFTINSLYYDIRSGDIIDWVGGLYDLREGMIRASVSAETTLRYDPRRLLRAIRFKSRFAFSFAEDIDTCIRKFGRSLVKRISPSAMYENLPDMFYGGYTRSSVSTLMEYHMLECLLPNTEPLCWNSAYREYVMRTAYAVDWLYDEGTVGLPLLAMAALLWPAIDSLRAQGKTAQEAAAKVLESQREVMSMSDEEADFMVHALLPDETDDEESLIERLDHVFGRPTFEDAKGMLRLNYMKYSAGSDNDSEAGS